MLLPPNAQAAADLTDPFSSFKEEIKAWTASDDSGLWLPKAPAASDLTDPFSSFKEEIEIWTASDDSVLW
ncbi:Uncharacterized protein MCB1EB_0122 [Mycoavidus cysteinexigens]|uniref:Uncharacterized protein n=1 Tax=Mycoavidus cysteinexigens TaxID=1553431 RepID=A0A2Z6ESA5_9BURK|nr:Uncharacterized protein MCB1EB_0122 [Mycoavidus cysteinexigens]GLR02163.1 hypothetical protein GCM10007934_19770 [Mycoavidus cysteinexigens]